MPSRKEELARYPANWAAISLGIRQRAAGQCECTGHCGLHRGRRCEERDHQPAKWARGNVMLTVAHLNHAPEDCREENLMAMCNTCHLRYDRLQHGEASARTIAEKKANKQGSLLPALAALLLSATATAQTVSVTTNGVVSITGGGTLYAREFALQQTDFGFLWLDSAQLSGGHVQAMSKCVNGIPPSASSLYCPGDCNGISSIAVSSDRNGGKVLVRQQSGQCWQTLGCGGAREPFHSLIWFQLGGNWGYLGDGAEITPSTQTTDPQGRTWTVMNVAPFDGKHYAWTATGGGGPTWTPTTATVPVTGSPSPSPTQTVLTPTPCSGIIIVMGRCYLCDGTEVPCPTTTTRTATTAPSATRSPSPQTTRSATPAVCGADSFFLGRRFCVSATWTKSNGQTGRANPTSCQSSNSGGLWFFDASNTELTVKVLNGCGTNNHYWIFAAGLTNVAVTLTVKDTTTGVTRTYANAQGVAFQPIQDTGAFVCP